MGYINEPTIQKAAKHLLNLLNKEETVNFSRFYDGTEETNKALEKATGIEGYSCSPSLAMDIAIRQLTDQFIITVKRLKENSDEETGYENCEFRLTDFGKKQLAKSEKLKFVGWDL